MISDSAKKAAIQYDELTQNMTREERQKAKKEYIEQHPEYKEYEKAFNDIIDEFTPYDYDKNVSAVLLGYDAVRVSNAENCYTIVLNRTKVIFKKGE